MANEGKALASLSGSMVLFAVGSLLALRQACFSVAT